MKKKSISAILQNLSLLPVDIKVLAAFSLIWSVFFLLLPLINDDFYQKSISFTGNLPAVKYLWLLVAVSFSIYFYPPESIRRYSRRWALLALFFILFMGVTDLWDFNANADSTPTQIYHPLRPFFHTLIPAIWTVFEGLKVAFEKQ